MGRDQRTNPFATWVTGGGGRQTESYDRLGRALQKDDMVYIIGKGDVMWRVLELKPVLDANAPAGLVQITLISSLMVPVPGGQRIADLIKVADASELKTPAPEGDQSTRENPPAPVPGGLILP